MTNQEVLIQEVQDEISAEMPERLRVIETAQEKDKEIQSRMERAEIGISHGSDKVVGLLMFLLATFVTCLLYTSPSPRDLSTSRMPSSA